MTMEEPSIRGIEAVELKPRGAVGCKSRVIPRSSPRTLFTTTFIPLLTTIRYIHGQNFFGWMIIGQKIDVQLHLSMLMYALFCPALWG